MAFDVSSVPFSLTIRQGYGRMIDARRGGRSHGKYRGPRQSLVPVWKIRKYGSTNR
jgi:hypothetical protein